MASLALESFSLRLVFFFVLAIVMKRKVVYREWLEYWAGKTWRTSVISRSPRAWGAVSCWALKHENGRDRVVHTH